MLWQPLGYRNRTILTILNLSVAPMPPIKFWLNLTYSLENMPFEEFQDSHQGWRPSLISEQNDLAILNLCVATMPSIKFRHNLTYGLEGDVV